MTKTTGNIKSSIYKVSSSDSIAQKKKKKREEFLQRRNDLSDGEYRKASAAIARTVFDQPEYREARVIHCYVSMNDRKEVETHALIKRMIQEGKKAVVPRVDFENRSMEHLHLTSFDRLEKNDWGILEPRSGARVYPKDLELVIVPMAGGDTKLNRIGYGGGFYDRFLSDLDIPRLGLAFDCCIEDQPLPTNEHDVPLTKIITEKRVLT